MMNVLYLFKYKYNSWIKKRWTSGNDEQISVGSLHLVRLVSVTNVFLIGLEKDLKFCRRCGEFRPFSVTSGQVVFILVWIRLFLHIYCRSGLNVTYLYVHAEILIDALDTLIGSSPPFIQHPIWEIWSSLEIQSWSSWAHYVHIILMTVDNKYQNGKQSAPCTWHNLNQPTKKFLLGGSHGLVVMGDN